MEIDFEALWDNWDSSEATEINFQNYMRVLEQQREAFRQQYLQMEEDKRRDLRDGILEHLKRFHRMELQRRTSLWSITHRTSYSSMA
ncbi:hypothetical protein PROFUN_08324 [Planoprotostelium fungivorum]|uniref:Uncharacterized protein n=1 Tax=Planoprotostelium fungivorum TaxID=1890364 RepID=A0A2P6NI12_9EUKA|nr:hypothetical protein PROFUN_08324 [Planoprotostelium fungivorum]